jgi:tetratricopeptide (TPR) repeat protein
MAVHKPITDTLHVGITAAKNLGDQLKLSFDALPEVLLIIVVIVLGALYYYTGRFLVADMHHRAALSHVAANDGIAVYNELVNAEQLNPYNDLYRSDLAQTNFALANAIAASKGPTEASPAGSLTDADRQNIQTLISQAITEGRTAVTLSPNNPLNWEVLGAIYRQISGVADNALAFSLDAYGQAIQKDPLNPNLRLAVGGIYYSAQSYDLAIRFFGDAVNLKPDLANGYYNLSVALKDKGELKGAVAAAERTVSLLEPTSPDYKAASDFLAELKKQDEEATKKAASTTAPAAQPNSALQNNKLPKVVDLPDAPQTATPEAVKRDE